MIPKDNNEMVGVLYKNKDIRSQKVKEAFLRIDRKHFLPYESEWAYANIPLPTLKGQTISAPSMVAQMVELLEIKQGNKVLEIGSGTGYLISIISILTYPGTVIGVEKVYELVEFSKERLRQYKINNAKIEHADGSDGWEYEAPYDKIIFSGAMPSLESVETAKRQLKEDGIMLVPIGKGLQKLFRWKDKKWDTIDDVLFVPIVGKKGFKEFL